MKEKHLILGSASPRRSDILKQVGIPFEIIPSLKEERITQKNPRKIVQELSLQKAMDVKEQAIPLIDKEKDNYILCADTMIAYQSHIMGKPIDKEDAKRMLMQLQGRKHYVYTGVTILSIKNGIENIRTFYASTKVYMMQMNKDEIESYVNTGECLGKAGAYAIQGYGAKYIRKINGDYYNVCGLPMAKIYRKCKEEWMNI